MHHESKVDEEAGSCRRLALVKESNIAFCLSQLIPLHAAGDNAWAIEIRGDSS